MKSSTFLRIASVITLLYFAGHTSGAPWTPGVGSEELPVLEAMKSHSFDVLGSTRSYWNLYVGFGIAISLFLLMQGVVLWQLGSLAKTDGLRIRPIIASFTVAFLVNTLVTWEYFFVVPAVMSAAISICLALAFIAAGRSKVTQ